MHKGGSGAAPFIQCVVPTSGRQVSQQTAAAVGGPGACAKPPAAFGYFRPDESNRKTRACQSVQVMLRRKNSIPPGSSTPPPFAQGRLLCGAAPKFVRFSEVPGLTAMQPDKKAGLHNVRARPDFASAASPGTERKKVTPSPGGPGGGLKHPRCPLVTFGQSKVTTKRAPAKAHK